MMGLSVRNSARQVGHQVAKYIIKTGRPAAAKSADAMALPSARSMAKAGGVSPTLVPSGADGVGGAVVAVGAGNGVLVGGGAVAVAVGDGTAVAAGATVGKTTGVAATVGDSGAVVAGATVVDAARGGVGNRAAAACAAVAATAGRVAVGKTAAGVMAANVAGMTAGGAGVSGIAIVAAVTDAVVGAAAMVATTAGAVVAAAAAASEPESVGGGVSGCWQAISPAPAMMPAVSKPIISLGRAIMLRSAADAVG